MANTGNLSVPQWIYLVRKAAVGEASIMKAMNHASQLLELKKYGDAEQLVAPIAIRYGATEDGLSRCFPVH